MEKLKVGSLACEVAMSSNVGLHRSENQDCFAFAQSSSANLFVVADGMGGARGGGTASAMAVNLIIGNAFDPHGKVEENAMVEAISLSNKIIFSRSRLEPNLHGMGTTLVAVSVDQEKVLVAHVGDSRVYHLRDKKLKQITRDHTLVQELIDNGAIDPANAESYPISHMLTRSLGPAESVKIDVAVMPNPQAGDKFLLCSDGLYNHVEIKELEDILNTSSGKSALIELEQLALDDGGSDNLTTQLIEFKDSDDEIANDQNLNGSVRKYIFSEMDVSTINGKSFPDYVESVLSGKEEAQEYVPDENLASVEEINYSETVKEDEDKDLPKTLTPEKATKRSYSQLALGVAFFLILALVLSNTKRNNVSQIVVKEKKLEVAPVSPTTTGIVVENTTIPGEQNSKEKIKEENSKIVVALTKEKVKTADPKVENTKSEQSVDDDIFIDEGKPFDNESQRLLTEEEALATDYFVSESPVISLGASDIGSEPNQPVDWQKEKNLVQVITLKGDKDPVKTAALPTLRTIGEDADLALKKQELRDKISDIDLKIAILFFASEKEASLKLMGLTKDIENSEKAIQMLDTELAKSEVKLKNWNFFAKKLEHVAPLKLADSIYHLSAEVREKRRVYSELTENYLTAVETWQNNPKDSQASSYMKVLSKEIKAKKLELENEVSNSIQRGILGEAENIKRNKFNLLNIQVRKDQLSHHSGFLKVFSVVSKPRKKEYQKDYLTERRSLVQQLKSLRNGFPDSQELSFRLTNVDLFYQK